MPPDGSNDSARQDDASSRQPTGPPHGDHDDDPDADDGPASDGGPGAADDQDRIRLVNGVFQGGGAKGIAYAGALRAVAERDVWFGSVAGTSAGSITAALVAARLPLDQFDDAVNDALQAAKAPIPKRLALAAAGTATSIFDAAPLRRWLDDTFAELIDHDRSSGPVTFEQLYRATKIELYVVSLDLVTEWPVVFSRRTTPTVDVAGAVAASSAIPAAFPAGRAVVRADGTGARVHQLIDGAGWANYPSFVFDDDGFRAWLERESRAALDDADAAGASSARASWERESARPVLGFVLGAPDPPNPYEHVGFVPLDGPTIDRRFDLGPSYNSSGRVTHLIGSVLSSDWARLTIAFALLIWVSLSVATMPIAFRRFSTWLATWMPDALYPPVLVGSLTVAVLAVVVSVLVITGLVIVSRLLADTLIPAVGTVLGTPSEVPPWLGLGGSSVVLRVPRTGLSTIDFDVDVTTRRAAVTEAQEVVGDQLDGPAGRRLDALLGGPDAERGEPTGHDADDREPPSAESLGDETDEPSARDPSGEGMSPIGTTAVIIALTTVVGGMAWWVTTAGSSAGVWWILAGVVATIVAVAAATLHLGARTARRAHARAAAGVTDRVPDRRRPMDPRIISVVGLVLIAGAVLLAVVGMSDRADDTIVAEVVEAIDDDGTNRYVMRSIDDDLEVAVISSRHLRLGERAFLELDGDGAGRATGAVVGPLDDLRFGVSVVLLALGVGALVSSARTRRWLRRADRLHHFVAGRDEHTSNGRH